MNEIGNQIIQEAIAETTTENQTHEIPRKIDTANVEDLNYEVLPASILKMPKSRSQSGYMYLTKNVELPRSVSKVSFLQDSQDIPHKHTIAEGMKITENQSQTIPTGTRMRDSLRNSTRLIHKESLRSIRASSTSIERPQLNLYPRKSVISSSSHLSAYGTAVETVPSQNTEQIPLVRPVSLISLKKLNQIAEAAATAVNDQVIHNEYNEYLLLQQRHSSSNYIHKVNSEELIWETKQLSVKMLGPYLMGGRIGKGAFGKVKEGICTDSLQRIAVKILAKKRVKKNIDNVIRF